MSVKLLALAASTRADSLNKMLLSVAVSLVQSEGAEVTVIDYSACDAPLFRDQENAPLPEAVRMLSHAVRTHDGLLLASPEYNWSIPGELKNLIDWLSVDPTGPLTSGTALLMCASPSVRGGIVGLQQLSVPLAHLGMRVFPQLIAVGDAKTQLNADRIARDADQQHLATTIHDFVQYTAALKGIRHA